MGSLTTIFIGLLGWRMTFGAIGGFFAAYCILSLFIVREPLRNQFMYETEDKVANVNEGNAIKTIFKHYQMIF